MNDKSMVSFYKNVFDTKGTPVSASSILNAIQSGEWKPQIEKLRTMPDEMAQKAFKNTLPCYTPSGLFSERNAESLISHSGVLLLDFDAKDNSCLVENFKEIRNELNADQYIYFLFTSCRGNGLALGVRIDPVKHLESFLFLERYYMEKYELVIDKGCKDACRLRFISYDPELFINEKAETVVPDVPDVRDAAVTTRHDQTSNGNMSDKETMDDIIASGVTLVDDHQHEARVKIAHALSTAFGESLGRMYTHSILAKCADYDAGITDKYFTGIHKNNKGTVKFRSIVFLAKQAGYTPTRKGKMNVAKSVFEEITAADVNTVKQDKKPKFANTDLGNAGRLVAQHGDKIRFLFARNKWLVWDGMRWYIDDNGQIIRLAKWTVRNIYKEAYQSDDPDEREKLAKWAVKSQGRDKISAMIELAKSEPGIPISPGELDKDLYLLNCPNGTLDLRTGTLQPHDPGDLITKLIPIKYDPGATCPEWNEFLETIFNWNYDLINYGQRAVGYSLTGDTSEQSIFIPHGEGENGKSTFIDTVSMLEGEYAQAANVETFMVKKNDGGTLNDIARMKGARFISAVETEDGKRLSEVLVKQLTGGDILSARFLYGEWFDFKPEAKIWLACNHKPAIRGTDHAIWRRIKLIPFTVKISPEKKLPKEKVMAMFRKELSGILTWAVQGCLEWQKNGLQTPDEVQAATGKYRDEMDTVGQFLDDTCILTPEVKAKASDLYDAYKTWCDTNGEFILTQRNFGSRLKQKGLERVKSNGNFWKGVGIKN